MQPDLQDFPKSVSNKKDFVTQVNSVLRIALKSI